MSLFQQLFDSYPNFHVNEIITNRFLPARFHQLFKTLAVQFDLKELGKSVEGRPLFSLNVGSGPVKILLWSQMHGNESTATRAILDMLKFFNEPGFLGDYQQDLLNSFTIKIIPMLNPDGAQRFQRRNALEVDLNRDAREVVSPESNAL